jgi:hypothetical protein
MSTETISTSTGDKTISKNSNAKVISTKAILTSSKKIKEIPEDLQEQLEIFRNLSYEDLEDFHLKLKDRVKGVNTLVEGCSKPEEEENSDSEEEENSDSDIDGEEEEEILPEDFKDEDHSIIEKQTTDEDGKVVTKKITKIKCTNLSDEVENEVEEIKKGKPPKYVRLVTIRKILAYY